MAAHTPTIHIPAIEGFYNLIVFPSPLKDWVETNVYVLKRSAEAPKYPSKMWEVEYVPGFIYCLLPSTEKSLGVAVYTSKPGFLDSFSYWHGIDMKAILIKNNTDDSSPKTESENINNTGSAKICDRCFVSHFPQPNMKSCKLAKERRKGPAKSFWTQRLRGGAGSDLSDSIIERATLNAKAHNINIHAGVRNLANGNCAFESIIDSINTRKAFDMRIDGTPNECRNIWMTEVQNIAFEEWNNGMSDTEWREGWETLKKSGVYECSLGDLVIPGIAHCIKKDIIIFNTSLSAHSPIYVIEASHLCGQKADTDVPICLAYDQSHYEAMVPNNVEDELKTIELKKQFIEGRYDKKMEDIPFMKAEMCNQRKSYAAALKRKLDDNSLPKIKPTPKKKTLASSNPKQDSEEQCFLSLEELKNIKCKDRTKAQTKKYNKLMAELSRKRKSEDQKAATKEKNKNAMSKSRAQMTEEEKKDKNNKNKNAMSKSRAKITEEEKKVRNENDKQAKKISRKSPKSSYIARNAQHVLYGSQIVQELENTSDKIGKMENICTSCLAKKWISESNTTCCNNGKVSLQAFPDPPPLLKHLWTANTPEGRLFRENSRSFNNGLALASLKVNERKFHGSSYAPSVVFEGKVQIIQGPVLAENNEQPKFAQIYIHDPSTQHTLRVNNMNLPAHLSKKQISSITKTMKKLQDLMMEVNPYVKDFLHIAELSDEDLKEGKLVISCQARPKGEHERRYNEQHCFSEVSVLTNSASGDLVLRKRGGGLQTISDLNPSAQPLHFTLLFPFGTKGYNEADKKLDKDGCESKRRITPREFFAFHINMRDYYSDFLFRGGRLFQEYLCIAYSTIESQRLKFVKFNQKALRADSYKNIKEVLEERVPMVDKILPGDDKLKFGRKVILPSSFVGSPRWYNMQFQDAMAICREYHKPDFFITMTCNPKWSEITRELREGEIVEDRPDLVSRVFKLKKDQLMYDIQHGNILGKVPAILWVIEFQKRGLPHVHILVILAGDDRITCGTDVDDVICAQLPRDPESFLPNTVERDQAERLQAVVLTSMVHGPCGKEFPDSPCMMDGKCSKSYPKKFCSKTVIDPDNLHPEYQRLAPEDGGRSIVVTRNGKQHVVDNQWIVPYSPFLSLRFNCHINIELCASPTASKYLYKYVYKGGDRAMVCAEVVDGSTEVNEVEEYEDLRSIGSSEASWHIFNFNIAKKYPAVYALRCHLEDENQIFFDEETNHETIEKQRNTELTEFLAYNMQHPDTNHKYVDFPKFFTWNKTTKKWTIRKGSFDTIGRVHAMHPLAGDVFYLRMILHHDHCRGKESFIDLRTVDGVALETYQEVCRQLGLLQDDREWEEVLSEGAVTKLSYALRELFVVILLFCYPANPKELFENFHQDWADDFKKNAVKKGVKLTDSQLKTMIILDIQQRLQSWDKDLKTFQLHEPTQEELDDISFDKTNVLPVLIREELDFDIHEMQELRDKRFGMFTDEQKYIADTVMEAVRNDSSLAMFIDARGGTGKTFVLNAILAAVRCLDSEKGGSVALATATTGIAANLLLLGRTFHSRFKADLSPHEESMCNINAKSVLADLIRMAKLIIVDECSMQHRYHTEALDRTLRDVTGQNKPFGGKIVLLSGDFRQCLPVIPGASRGKVVDAALNRSSLWSSFIIKRMSINMRVKSSGNLSLASFDDWTVQIGDGLVEMNGQVGTIEMPNYMCIEIKKNSKDCPQAEKESMKNLAERVYPNMHKNCFKPNWMDGRAILAPTNKRVDSINNLISETFPGKPVVLTSSDEIVNPQDLQRYNIEYLNTLTPSGMPVHRLFLKNGIL